MVKHIGSQSQYISSTYSPATVVACKVLVEVLAVLVVLSPAMLPNLVPHHEVSEGSVVMMSISGT